MVRKVRVMASMAESGKDECVILVSWRAGEAQRFLKRGKGGGNSCCIGGR